MKTNYDVTNFDTIVKENISEMIKFFLEDLENFNEENDIKMTKKNIQNAINKLKEKYKRTDDSYYSFKEHYEEITEDASDEFFEELQTN